MAQQKNDQEVFFGGEGSGAFLLRRLNRISASRILFVTGRESFHRSGAEAFLADTLGQGMKLRFSEFNTSPSDEEVCNGLAYARSADPDCVIAVGGGSVMDMAKLINFHHVTRTRPSDPSLPRASFSGIRMLPSIAIPTTAGSGSEATTFAVMYRQGGKVSIEHPGLKPHAVVLNPEFTSSMSAYQTACCGFDALAQSIESCWAVGSTACSRRLSDQALALCRTHLEPAVLAPTAAHREGMMSAAHLAGQAINLARTTAAHALSYSFTHHYGVAHGHAVALLLPWVFEVNAGVTADDVNDARGVEHVDSVMNHLCRMLGCRSAREASTWIRTLAVRVGLETPACLKDEDRLEIATNRMVQEVNQERLSNNPRRLGTELIDWIADRIH